MTRAPDATLDALVAELVAIGDPGRTPIRHSRGDVRLVSYSRRRLWFIRDEMEMLPPEGTLLLHVAPTGGARFWVRITRREFEATFQHILSTRSWLGPGEYHYSTFPQKAVRYVVPDAWSPGPRPTSSDSSRR